MQLSALALTIAGVSTLAGCGGSSVSSRDGTPSEASGGSGDSEGGTSGAPGCGSAEPPAVVGQLIEITTEVEVRTSCSAPPFADRQDECGCDARACAEGATCVRVREPPPASSGGPETDHNGCFALCDVDRDCDEPFVCVANLYGLKVCATVECRSDEDCTARDCGLCVAGYRPSHAGTVYSDPTRAHCWYGD